MNVEFFFFTILLSVGGNKEFGEAIGIPVDSSATAT